MRLHLASLVVALSLLTSTTPVSAQNAWVLWRHLIPVGNPTTDDARMWRAQPGTKTQKECELEAKEYRSVALDKPLLGPAGPGYRIEYHCLPDTVDPRGAKR